MTSPLLSRLFFSLMLVCGMIATDLYGQNSLEADGQASAPVEQVALAPRPHPETLVPDDDPRWDLMGEFAGDIVLDGESARFGLQLRPAGELNFEGQLYRGGLPGEKDFDKDGTQVVGLHSGKFVVISGGPAVIIARPDSCLVVDEDGNQIGVLERKLRVSPTLGAKPPRNAIVLFDGTNTDQFANGKITHDGLLAQGATVSPMAQDFNLHVEFLIPYQPDKEGQKRGNSGCYLHGRYEVQILDSFGLAPVVNGCGSLYQTRPPRFNMSFPPLRWQTYDIVFTAPRWLAGGEKRRNAHITVWHNGVKVHDDLELKANTGAGMVEEPRLLPTRFQSHGAPVRYRNLWMVDRGLEMGGEFPRYPDADQEVSTDPPQGIESPPPALESE